MVQAAFNAASVQQGHLGPAHEEDGFCRDKEHVAGGREKILIVPKRLAQESARAIAFHGIAHSFGRNKTGAANAAAG